MCLQANNPFVIIKRCHSLDQDEQIDPVIVHKSQINTETTSPKWSINKLKAELLCNSDLDLPVIFEVWSHSKLGSHSKYGSFQTTINGIKTIREKKFKLKDDSDRDAGTFEFTNFKVTNKPTIIDYIRSGWIISLCVAIDFTASNKRMTDPKSLHYLDPDNPDKLNKYEEAIS